jgi:heat shock protein HtpX
MSALARRSAAVLALLFGLLFAVGIGFMWYLRQPLWLAALFALVIVGAQYAAGPWIIGLIYKIRWVEPEAIHPDFARWYREACAVRKIPVPRFGIIDDGKPNAFTYGHTPADARVVVTSGLLQMLTAEEAHAVVAHELGHVANRDFIVMTVASAVPILLYVIYWWTRGSGSRNRDGNYAALVGLGAYVAYLVSQFIVLLLSRVREYFADEVSARTTGNPNALTSALVKIAYGLAHAESAAGPEPAGQKRRPFDAAGAMAGLGIANARAASRFAATAVDASGQFSGSMMARAMQWDLKNPWARWYEFQSTHPLTGRRIQAMNEVARRMGVPPLYELPAAEAAQARYTGNLALELLIWALPWLLATGGLVAGIVAVGVTRHPGFFGLPLLAGGLGLLAQVAYSYPGAKSAIQGPPRTVESLVGEINVSQITPVPCAVQGEIIGRGAPGLFWSKDLVLRDATGFVTLLYRQPLGFLEFLFGWLKAEKFVGRPARVFGWYRRNPVPYLEVQRIEMLDGTGETANCYYVWGTLLLAALLTVAGLLMLAFLPG